MSNIESLKEMVKELRENGFSVRDEVSYDDVYTEEFFYDLTDGGYIKPENILEDKTQIELVQCAAEILKRFENLLCDLQDDLEDEIDY